MNNYKLAFYTDDDPDDLNLMEEITDSLGHTCQLFHSGVQLLSAIHELKEPSIFFLDIHMPLLDGYETLRSIREHKKFDEIPIVMLTGNCDEKCIQTCLDLGANFFITKGRKYSDIKDCIAHAINKDWLNHKPLRGNFVHNEQPAA